MYAESNSYTETLLKIEKTQGSCNIFISHTIKNGGNMWSPIEEIKHPPYSTAPPPPHDTPPQD